MRGTIADDSRIVACGSCGQEHQVAELLDRGPQCKSCGDLVCCFCGCTETAACIDENYPDGSRNCAWREPGVCDRCFNELAELEYLRATGKEKEVRQFEPRRRPAIVVAQGL